MNGGTLVGHFRLKGVDMCNENWLRQDDAGLYATISFYPNGQDESERQKWIVRPDGISEWADANPQWFEIICAGGLQMSLGDELIDLDSSEDEAFKMAKSAIFDGFMKAATDRGLWFNGMGTLSVKMDSDSTIPTSNEEVKRPLWRRILGLA